MIQPPSRRGGDDRDSGSLRPSRTSAQPVDLGSEPADLIRLHTINMASP